MTTLLVNRTSLCRTTCLCCSAIWKKWSSTKRHFWDVCLASLRCQTSGNRWKHRKNVTQHQKTIKKTCLSFIKSFRFAFCDSVMPCYYRLCLSLQEVKLSEITAGYGYPTHPNIPNTINTSHPFGLTSLQQLDDKLSELLVYCLYYLYCLSLSPAGPAHLLFYKKSSREELMRDAMRRLRDQTQKSQQMFEQKLPEIINNKHCQEVPLPVPYLELSGTH